MSEDALAALIERTRGRLEEVLPDADVRLSGGVLVEGGAADDVDLVALVEDVRAAASALVRTGFPSLYEEEWGDDWAAFRDPGPPQIDVVVTRLGTKGDDHHRRAWELLMRDPALLADYRALKTRRKDYEERKAAFFERVVARLPPA
jgi:hypothetical protein